MTTPTPTKQANRTGGHHWGPRRVEAGIGLKALHEATGIAKGTLSMIEHGRMNPTPEELAAVDAALAELTHEHEWERGRHMKEAFGVPGNVNACAICGIRKGEVDAREANDAALA